MGAGQRTIGRTGGGTMWKRARDRQAAGLGAPLLATTTLATTILGGVALAQSEGGQTLTLGFGQRFEATDNQTLSATSAGSLLISATQLSFSYADETRIGGFTASGGAVVRAVNGPGTTNRGIDLEEPSVRLSYLRNAADGEFAISGRVSRNNIAFLRPIEDFIDPDTGEFLPPEDIDDLTGSGTRLSYGADVRLRLRDQAPLGVTLRTGVSGLTYQNATNTDLEDNQRLTAGATLRFTLSPVTTATVDLGWSRLSEDNAIRPDRDTVTLVASVAQDRSNGQISARLATEKGDGRDLRYTVVVGRSYDLPRGGLSFGSTATWGDIDGVRFGGSFGWRQELPTGAIQFNLSHQATTASDDTTNQTTSANARWQYSITEISSISVDLGLNRSTNLDTNDITVNSSIGLGYTHQLTEDWALSADYRRRDRDESGVKARSDTVSVEIRRNFQTKF